MRRIHRLSGIATLAALAVLAGSCESNNVLAPKGTTILMTANPPRVVFDPADTAPIHVTVTAELMDENGYPKTGIAVVFSTTGGTLASEGRPIETDTNSIASDDLLVAVDSPNSIEVKAQSGTISGTITLTKTVAGLAPSDGSMGVSANPATIVIDPNNGETSGVTQLTAQAFDKEGAPLASIAVRFRSTAGTVGSAFPILTDTEGIAVTTLTMTTDDPDSATVTASSSALSATVAVTKAEVALNHAPVATISAIPANRADAGTQVIFDGSGSADTDGTIVNYKWSILSDSECCDTPPPSTCQDACATEVIEDATAFGFGKIYNDAPQNLSVTLEVTDDDGAVDVRIISYEIQCTNPAPVANAGPDQTQNASTSGQTVNVILNGTTSTDDRPISTSVDHYRWDCGNGTVAAAVVAGDYRQVLCRYTAIAGLENSWTATLTVFDNGSTGDLVNGVYPCQKSATDTATVKLILP
jgi:hypothetical protein